MGCAEPFFRHYFVTLLIAKSLLWLIERICLYAVRFNH
jgi:hypothetical protein